MAKTEEFDAVERPAHYAEGRRFEPINVIEDWELGFHEANAVKYLSRAGRKGNRIEDLRKAVWYINRRIKQLEGEKIGNIDPGMIIAGTIDGAKLRTPDGLYL